MSKVNPDQVAEQVLAGSRLALARALSWIENDRAEGREVINLLFPYTGRAHLVGITGAPGTGKSSLVNQLARHIRLEQHETQRVGIVAVDPSSPFSGGAILGDRVRMRDLAGDPGVFIRSMASRGSLGGLAAATAGVVQAFDAAGFDLVLIETIGAGQAEVEIASLAHTTIVVEAPGFGDEIQAIKAGILEIADILVVNKADRPGVENTERALRNMLQLATSPGIQAPSGGHHDLSSQPVESHPDAGAGWTIPILKTVAIEGNGIHSLAEQIHIHQKYLRSSGELERRDRVRLQAELENLIRTALVDHWRSQVSKAEYRQVLDQLAARRISPRQGLETLLRGVEI